MAKQTINIGAAPNDGSGNNLRVGGAIINDNFNEIYNAIGNGTTITLTATPTELNLLSGATAIATNNNTIAFSNKTISGSSNTLSNIANSSLTNSSFSIRDDSSSAISIALGGTLKIKSNDGITTTVSEGDTITIGLDSNVLTETSSDVLTNKTIAAGSNTITGLTNTNLSGTAGITNANIQNAFIQFSDESSTSNSVSLGGKLEFLAGEGINTIVGASSLTISAELATSSNAGVATFNTASFAVSTGDVTIKSAGVSNAQLANSTVSIGGNTITLGAAATTSISDLSLTGNGTIDSTGSGNKIRFDFANTGAFPNSTTYQGQFAIATGTAKAYFADSGAYNEILSENSSIKDLSDVAGTNPTNGQILIFNGALGRYEPGNQSGGGGSSTLIVGDNTSTIGTINLATQTLGFVGTNGITTTVNNDNSTIETRLTDDFYADNYLPASAVFDVTHGGGYYFFNSHYSGNSPTLYLKSGHTYAFKLNVAGHPFHLQTIPNPAGGYPVTYSAGNPYTTGLVHVSTNGTVTTGAVGPQIAGTLYFKVPANSNSKIYYACQNHQYMGNTIVLGSLTDTFTGDGSTVTYSINNGRNVNDILVIVNGIMLVPTTDYTITNTGPYNIATITFQVAPAASAEIQVRYL
jgi:hypothetical protein